ALCELTLFCTGLKRQRFYTHSGIRDGNSKLGDRLGDNFNEHLIHEGQSIAAA
ncbi:hypothetical protein EDB86DRAFT_3150094, partial [Lactarius hatsudake]